MPSNDILERFIARVEQNVHADAIAEFYALSASMQENQSPTRVGREALVEHERRVLARTRSVSSKCIRPVFVNGDYVVIRWRFQLDWLDGTFTRMEELAYQHWEDDLIAEETFFYDPAQRTPQPGGGGT